MAPPKTVLITGSSSGIGRAAVIHFQAQGWNVAATMRNPDDGKVFASLTNVACISLDVRNTVSIDSAIAQTIAKFGRIDAIVNNAGYGLIGPFEGFSEDQIARQFDTNVFGLMRVTKAVLPHLRANKAGIVINISSIGGRLVFPLYSAYHATKWAVEGFTESLRFEVEPLGIRVKLVEPGAIRTDFYGRSKDSSMNTAPADYKAQAERGMHMMNKAGANGTSPEKVAAAIFKAASDNSSRLRYPVGRESKTLLLLRRCLPDSLYAMMVRKTVFGVF